MVQEVSRDDDDDDDGDEKDHDNDEYCVGGCDD